VDTDAAVVPDEDNYSEAESCDVVPQAVVAVTIKGDNSHATAYVTLDENAAKGHLKVTKEDIQAGSHDKAQLKELQSWYDHGVLGKVIKQFNHGTKFIQAWWVNSWKKTPEGREAKSRLVVDGSRDYRDLSVITTYAGTGIQGQLRSTDVFALEFFNGSMALTDVTTAFIRSDANHHFLVNVKLPPKLPPGAEKLGYVPGGVYPQVKAIYGLADAPRRFHELLKAELRTKGWEEIANSIFLLRDQQAKIKGIISAHVDDLWARGNNATELLCNLGDKLGITKVTKIEHGKLAVYTGCNIIVTGKEMRNSRTPSVTLISPAFT
jgi:hypothetical protein